MKYLSINSKPYSLDFALFDYDTKCLLQYGTAFYKSKTESERIEEIVENLSELLNETSPTIVLTQMIDLRHTLKRDLEHIIQIRTILRMLCYRKSIMYNEFKTDGWTKRITSTKYPSKKAKLKIAHEYSKKIDREEIADAIILGEGVVWGRLQIGID